MKKTIVSIGCLYVHLTLYTKGSFGFSNLFLHRRKYDILNKKASRINIGTTKIWCNSAIAAHGKKNGSWSDPTPINTKVESKRSIKQRGNETHNGSNNNSSSKVLQRNRPRQEKTVVLLYNKPKNVITSHSNSDSTGAKKDQTQESRITVYDDIKSMKGFIPNDKKYRSDLNDIHIEKKSFESVTGIQSKLHAIGRLDVDTTGLLLLTNDGGLVHHVTNPTASTKMSNTATKNEQPIIKTYEALIMGYHTLPSDHNNSVNHDNHDNSSLSNNNNHENNEDTSQGLLKLFKGVDIGKKYGGMTKPVNDLQVLSHPTSKSTLVRISISEGKNRQVRRMFHAIGSGVMSLHRSRIGDIDLKSIMLDDDDDDDDDDRSSLSSSSNEGRWRLLSDEEIFNGLGWKVRVIPLSYQDSKSNNNNKVFSKKKRKRRRPTDSSRNHN